MTNAITVQRVAAIMAAVCTACGGTGAIYFAGGDGFEGGYEPCPCAGRPVVDAMEEQ